jgi:hypothetical protein
MKEFDNPEAMERDVAMGLEGKSAQARRLKIQEENRLGTASQNIASAEEINRAARTVAVEKRNMSETEAGLREGFSWLLQKVGMVTPNMEGETAEQKNQRIASQAFTLLNFNEEGGISRPH